MSTLRFRALEIAIDRAPVKVSPPSSKISDYFGINVFNKEAMQKHLPREAYKAVMAAIEHGVQVERSMADLVALGMKDWASSKGCTHYTHWFQPLTGLTAEKHDSFFEVSDGKAIEHFSGNALAQQEPDASSFPSGGIRNTFEARGYTAWDPSSPAFIIESASGKTLCIPTIFVSYTGETLDYKAPLLKALHVLDKAAVDVCQLFDKDVNKVHATLGVEQEYFLVDTSMLNSRPDLLITGRTLFGHSPAKGQQLEDHYFGSIPERVYAFMLDFETEAYKLGIPLKTRHNEVAPSQFECAPVFEEINLAVDHNALLMDLMEKVAKRHHFKVLLHEKPYAGINGSGKHNNWSLSTNTGKNLLSPGSTPKSNLMFLTFFVNTIRAVYEHADLLRASIASASNDHRLGANEAPPAIMSIFLGRQLTNILNEIVEMVPEKKMTADEKTALKLNIGKIPEILLDNTDRNRTSPFAFTGNKFEFRAVGSSANCSNAMMVLNTIVASQLRHFKNEVDKLMEKGDKKDEAILKVLRQYIVESKNILFEGNGYSEEWKAEAKKRGLSNVQTTPPALDAYVSKKSVKLFDELEIFNHREIEARHEIMLETYIKKIQIEARVMGDLVVNHIIPAALKYQTVLSSNVESLTRIGMKQDVYATQVDMITEISEHVTTIKLKVNEMIEARKKANKIENVRDKAVAYCDEVRSYFDIIRYHVDKLEMIIDDEMWPIAKYRELVNIR
ncbi:MAG: glutamine synthetase type III [Bacteroidetes bacterium]|nr:MAG: glutamine synthetase type III [Bacteroidota bacterium]REK00418.1 MAG: glutamine synthetase type III [Bacteroidota bacterium]REK05075.1 MAG: glutamine synthetase type III [Bacteroidota bacterium]REK35536.1 MAG: glutamine synthetase type III [Bacteroidota bacterium]REK51638.1 MAG: glutamine synthetase type III [Bacteroidota bacterium]